MLRYPGRLDCRRNSLGRPLGEEPLERLREALFELGGWLPAENVLRALARDDTTLVVTAPSLRAGDAAIAGNSRTDRFGKLDDGDLARALQIEGAKGVAVEDANVGVGKVLDVDEVAVLL